MTSITDIFTKQQGQNPGLSVTKVLSAICFAEQASLNRAMCSFDRFGENVLKYTIIIFVPYKHSYF